MNIYSIPTYLGNNDEVFQAYPRRADTLDVHVGCILLVITRSTKEKGVDKQILQNRDRSIILTDSNTNQVFMGDTHIAPEFLCLWF